MAQYRAAALRREAEERAIAAPRETRAWEVARRAAAMLRARFGAARVVVFGSLVHPGCFTRWSDVDLAAWGIPPGDTFRAIGAAMDIDPEIEVNLVVVDACRSSLRAVIEREGVEV
ncbi:MAG: nucleotidyltransferase domain-containing protein [Planctomycetes bacterium]|nr:nucleotidyltransferase domain-containing protein [Planctomycetota bacterium]